MALTLTQSYLSRWVIIVALLMFAVGPVQNLLLKYVPFLTGIFGIFVSTFLIIALSDLILRRVLV